MPGKEKKRGGGPRAPRAGNAPAETAAPAVVPVHRAQPVAGYDGPPPGAPQQQQRAKFDPALDEGRRAHLTDMVRNIDIGAGAFNIDYEYDTPATIAKRQGFNQTGKAIQLAVNAYPITAFPTKTVQQYDVLIGNGVEKRAVIEKVWASKARKSLTGSATWIFDGNKLAWSLQRVQECQVTVDLDAEENRKPGKEPNTFRIVIRPTKTVNLVTIDAFLKGRADFSNDTLEALNFLDHLLRESPSKDPTLLAVKRSFFSYKGELRNLGTCVEAWKGVYQSIKLAHPGRLVVNLDVANTCFWNRSRLVIIATNLFQCRDVQHLFDKLKPPVATDHNIESKDFHQLKRLHKLRVTAKYRGCPFPDKEWTIKHFLNYDAKTWTTPMKDPATGEKKEVTIYDYFNKKYNIQLECWRLPLVQMTKKNIVYPMELLGLQTSQKYNYKLTDLQTAEMIKFAVAPPASRMESINKGKAWLDWGNDPVLNDFGMKISPEMIKTNARLLPSPDVEFGGRAKAAPGVAGRWDLRGKKFYATNPQELKSWGIGVFPGSRHRPDPSQIEAFGEKFRSIYAGHGGRVINKPLVMQLTADAANGVETLHQSVGNKFNQRPQLLIFLVQDRNAFHYTRIKKSCDCRFGVMSQVMQLAQVQKGSPQYISNVLMKVNAKLGGTTAKAASKGAVKDFAVPTMLIGADVSHASPGSPQASMAAMTMSLDRFGGRYAAACETNGHRVEIISQNNVRRMMFPLVNHWAQTVGGGRLPQQVLYFRDGVSEGQFQHVIKREIPHLKEVFQKVANGTWGGKIAVIIASKRHHVRAFPKPGDRGSGDPKGNPLPGALVEQDVTHPFEWDFYLWSHTALQGTSRPTHYQVIMDEVGLPVNMFHNLIYEHCYQYMRSTTAVSLFPAVYYAHLASNRARAHEDIAAAAGPQTGPGIKLTHTSSSGDKPETEAKPLMPLFDNLNKIGLGMWYI